MRHHPIERPQSGIADAAGAKAFSDRTLWPWNRIADGIAG